jgi:LuxR family transcriptional regulator, maltose regulon positive regulatory protein
VSYPFVGDAWKMERLRFEGPLTPVTRDRPPPVPGDLVSRPRLLDVLENGAGRKLTLVSAPAGFGKTTLLAEWPTKARRPVAWLSLDEADSDPAVLWTDVVEALGRALPAFPTAATPSPDAVAAALGKRRGEVALVLDGYERIAGAPSDDSLWSLVDDAPPTLQLVVSGRVDPPFPVEALRERGELLEIRTNDLRMTDVEAAELLERALGGSLAVRELLRQIDRCEGWPAALRLVAYARSAESADAHLTELVGEILAARPEELDFLLRTSVLDELTGPLCDAVLGTSDSSAMLRRIGGANLLVEPVDDRGERYRLHGELRRVLQMELGRTAPEYVPTLHRRAASWYRHRPLWDAAVEHALLGGDFAEAGRTIARSWRRLVEGGEQARVLGWIERLPRELVDDDPRLGLVRAWLLVLDGRRAESEASLEAARRAATAKELRDAVGREAVLLRAVVPWDDVGAALTLARQAREWERFGARRSLAAWALGSASWWSGDLDAASDALADALDGPLLVRCAAQALLSRIALERGEEELALSLARTADRALRENGLAHLWELGMVATALGAADGARSPGSGALAQLERGVRLRRAWKHPLETADALIAAAPTAAAVLGRRQAATMLGEARQLVAACADPGALAERLARAERTALPRPDRLRSEPVLSERELVVLRLLAEGRSKREIGAELYLSFNTVHSHTKAIYRKLGVSSRHEAVARAHELGVG